MELLSLLNPSMSHAQRSEFQQKMIEREEMLPLVTHFNANTDVVVLCENSFYRFSQLPGPPNHNDVLQAALDPELPVLLCGEFFEEWDAPGDAYDVMLSGLQALYHRYPKTRTRIYIDVGGLLTFVLTEEGWEKAIREGLFSGHYEDICVVDVSSGRVRVNFAQLNRVVLERAQDRLVDAAFDFAYRLDDGDIDDFATSSEKLLSEYVSAWNSLELMRETRKKKNYDPFGVSTDYAMQRFLLQDVHEAWCKHDLDKLKPTKRKQFLGDMEQLTATYGLDELVDKKEVLRFGGGTRSSLIKNERVEHYTRKVIMAMIGGSFLIGPMLVMVLHPGLVTSLVATSACIFAFGLAMSIFLNAPFDVLSGTASYAAVLVVFIGMGGGT
ncbi:hypothetical protein F5883DRAFT_701443 [Diaporthe sp. PMI_573]|nr:hypothetical protein F5883DRAFT_701443 [Diaporthaceae sp. PMI_573]